MNETDMSVCGAATLFEAIHRAELLGTAFLCEKQVRTDV